MHLTELQVEDRVSTFEEAVVSHNNYETAIQSISTLHMRWRPKGQKKRKARALLILGNSGSGKTTILEQYEALFPASDTPDGDLRPVIICDAPKGATSRQLAAAILGSLSPSWRVRDGWNTYRIIREICFFCDEMQVAIILIDEAHHIVENKSEAAREDAADFIKSLLNRCGAQIVLAGLPHLAELPLTRKLKQLRRRFDPKVSIFPYNWSTKDGRLRFLSLLSDFEQLLSLPESSDLASSFDLAARIYCATGGEPGIISKHLAQGLRLALQRSLPKIDLKLLGEVFDGFRLRNNQQPLLMFDAKLTEATDVYPRSENPYLADDASFRKLWSDMASAIGSDTSAITRHSKKTPPEPSVFARAG